MTWPSLFACKFPVCTSSIVPYGRDQSTVRSPLEIDERTRVYHDERGGPRRSTDPRWGAASIRAKACSARSTTGGSRHKNPSQQGRGQMARPVHEGNDSNRTAVDSFVAETCPGSPTETSGSTGACLFPVSGRVQALRASDARLTVGRIIRETQVK